MRKLTIRRAAQSDLRDIQSWYNVRRDSLGDEFLLKVSAVFLKLEQSADRFPIYYGSFRRIIIRGFPYKIFYRVEGDAVIVFRVLHVARDHHSEL